MAADGYLQACINRCCPPCGNGNEGAACLTEFSVSDDPDGAAFTSIQAAYDAAVAMGFGPNNPAQVLVCPGTYTEDVTLTTPGINIVAVTNNPQARTPETSIGETVLVGTLTIDLTPAATAEETIIQWQGVDIRPASGVGISFEGINFQLFVLNSCVVESVDDLAISMTNTGVDGFNTSGMRVIRAGVLNPSDAIGVASTIGVTTGAFESSQSSLGRIGGGPVDCFTVSSDSANVVCEDTFIQGTNTIAAGSMLVAESVVQTTGTTAFTVSAPSGFLQMLAVKIGVAATVPPPAAPFIVGDGFVFHDGFSFFGTPFLFLGAQTPSWAPTLSVVTAVGLPEENYIQELALPAEISTQNQVAVTGPGTLTLPSAAARPGPIFIKPTDATAVTVAAQPGEFIRLGTGLPAASVTLPDGGAVFTSFRTGLGPIWEAYEFGGGSSVTCLDIFLVAPSPALAPYTSIQAAYDAAALAVPVGTRAKVLVCPGVYTEDVTMTRGNIDIVAIDQNTVEETNTASVYTGGPVTNPGTTQGNTVLQGVLTVDFAAASGGYARWQGIDIVRNDVSPDSSQVIFISTAPPLGVFTNFAIENSVISNNADLAVTSPLVFVDSAVVAGETTRANILTFVRCRLEDSRTLPPTSTLFDIDLGIVYLNDTHVQGVPSGDGFSTAISIATDDSRLFATGSTITGEIDTAGEVSATFSSVTTQISTGATGSVSLDRCRVGRVPGAVGDFVSGTGAFNFDTVTIIGANSLVNFLTSAAAVTVTQDGSVPPGAPVFSVSGGFVITQQTNLLVLDAGPASVPITLPLAAHRLGPIRIKGVVQDTPAPIDVFTQGGETINGLAAPFTIGAGTTGATFVSDGSGNWEVYG